MWICSNCGHENPDAAKECICGYYNGNRTPVVQKNYCHHCGAEIEPGAMVCAQCGFSTSSSQIVTHQRKAKKWLISVIAILIAFFLVIVGAVYYMTSVRMSEEETMIVEALQDCAIIATFHNEVKTEWVGDIEVIACSDIYYELPDSDDWEQPFFGLGEELFDSFTVWYCMIEISDDEETDVYFLLKTDNGSLMGDYEGYVYYAHSFVSEDLDYSVTKAVFDDRSGGEYYVPDGNDINVKHLNKALSE